MKRIACLIFFIVSITTNCIAQDAATPFYEINKLPAEGVLLDKNWKFHAGDNPEWANHNFDDSRWQPINPSVDIHFLTQVRKAEIGWFRLHIKVDSSLLNQPLALKIQQIGASEFYLNGKPILRFGMVSKDSKKEVLYNPNNNPYPFQWSDTEQVLAVRYSFTAKNFYFNNQGFGNPCLVVKILPMQDVIKELIHEKSYFSMLHFAKLGFLFLLFLLHFFFYVFYHERKSNLYYSLFAFAFMLYIWIWYAVFKVPREGQSFFILSLLSLFTAFPSLFFALTAVYSHARQQKGLMYWFVFLCLLLTYPAARWPYQWGWLTIIFYASIIGVDAIRVSVLAIRRKIIGSWIIFSGWMVFMFSTGFGLMSIYGVIKPADLGPNAEYINDFAYNAGFVFLWLPFSIILAFEFAQTNRSLKKRVKEVEELSDKTLLQEQEKQQLLMTEKERLEQQVAQRTAALKQSLDELKATQAQLIQSEKMASLGELTAGIAHEIQNPLNFVNNFSDVNAELIDELKNEINTDNKEEAILIADDIKENEQKINHHGHRADAIVKGMLQHSRASTGKKEPTDINALVDEYLRLSYHGLRAKDKEFDADFKTDFDESIGKIEVVPQDIGRVLLNLYNNAFYACTERSRSAVNEKKKTASPPSKGGIESFQKEYEPTVTVTTSFNPPSGDKGAGISISVKDNGNGIPQKVVDKIFQPFFTTKPTGQGTGLGLSLSYDIIKAHGGEIKVETKEGEGAEFIIDLPIKHS